MQYPRYAQDKFRNGRVEAKAVFRHHLITALHRSYRGGNSGAACIFKAVARLQERLLTHYSKTPHLLDASAPIRDNPMAADELSGHSAGIGKNDRIREYVAIKRLVRLFRKIGGVNLYDNLVFFSFSHGRIAHYFAADGKGSAL